MERTTSGEPDFEPASLVTFDEFEEQEPPPEDGDAVEQVDEGFEPAALVTFDEFE